MFVKDFGICVSGIEYPPFCISSSVLEGIGKHSIRGKYLQRTAQSGEQRLLMELSAVYRTTLLHACETWTVYSRHAKQLRLLRIK